jgi:hypothetical protein
VIKVAGKADGTVAAERSRTAILVALAAAAERLAVSERPDFIARERFGLSDRDVHRALRLRRTSAEGKAVADPDQHGWAWKALEGDAAKLGLDLIVAWLPRPAGPESREDQAELLSALRNTAGVLSIDDCFDDTVVVRALAPDPASKRQLQSRFKELCPGTLWAEVRQTDHSQPARGWLHVARVVADAEGRLKTPQAEASKSA